MCDMKSVEANDNLWLDYLQYDMNMLSVGKEMPLNRLCFYSQCLISSNNQLYVIPYSIR